MTTLALRLIGHDPPGRSFGEFDLIYAALRSEDATVQTVRGDVSPAVFDLDVHLLGDEFHGPFVHTRRGRRFLSLVWGEFVLTDGGRGDRFDVFRHSRIMLPPTGDPAVRDALVQGSRLQVEFSLSDTRGEPISETLRAPNIQWRPVPRNAAVG